MDGFEAELWRHPGEAGWHFVTVPPALSDAIEARSVGARRGFGSVRVRVVSGSSRWTTSVFPDRRRGAYVLPVKREVRAREGLVAGDRMRVGLELIDHC